MGDNIFGINTLQFYYHKAKNIPLPVLMNLAAKKTKRKIENKIRKVKAKFFCPYLSDLEFVKNLNKLNTINDTLEHFRERNRLIFFWDSDDKDKIIRIIQTEFPNTITQTLVAADEICEHIFNLLGSGKKKLGVNIDWHTDFKSGYRWDPNCYGKDIVKINHRDNSDIKVPWELSRFQHTIILGKAYWYTNNEKYAQEFVDQVTNWIQSNKTMLGVNWCSTMDVAIRAINWIWGFYFFRHTKSFTDNFILDFLKSLLMHGQFIYTNLEYDRRFIDGSFKTLNGNHYISHIVGLIYLGVLFPEFSEANEWLKKGLSELFIEMEKEILPDGVHWELSISYHRLVLEMCLSAILICQRNDIEIPQKILNLLEKMLDFVVNYTKPNGMCPLIRDADNGRLLILGQNQLNDHRYILAIGAILFKRKDFKKIAGQFHEEALWLLGPKSYENFKSIPLSNKPLQSKAFKESGYYIMRKDDLHLIIISSHIGMNGYYGGHGHNDCLSYELYAFDKTLLTDSGTYGYSFSPFWRNKFRSTAFHNTVVVDECEINRFEEDKLFMLYNDAVPQVNKWIVTKNYDLFDAQHSGYKRLMNPVIHRRQIYFDKMDNYFIIRDIFTSSGKHKYDLFFHFSPGIKPSVMNNLTGEILIKNSSNLIILPLEHNEFNHEIIDGWVSLSYGIKEKAKVLKYSKNVKGPFIFSFILYPYRDVMYNQINNLKTKALDIINTTDIFPNV